MPKTLLVADDSLTIRKVIGMVLALEDFQITAVDNGIDAIARAREMRPDLVIADVLMPGRSGYEVCETLKADPATASTPVLLLAGNFEPFDEARARAARADAHITKPFESQAFLDRVRNAARAPRRPADDAGSSGSRDRAAAGDLATGGAPAQPAHGLGRSSARVDRRLLPGDRAPARADRRGSAAHARPGRHPASRWPRADGRSAARGWPGPHADGRAAAPGAAAPRTPQYAAGREHRPSVGRPHAGGPPAAARSSSAVAPCRGRLVRACRSSRSRASPGRRRR